MANNLIFEINYDPNKGLQTQKFYFEFYLDGKIIGREKTTCTYLVENGVHTVQCYFNNIQNSLPRTELGLYQFEVNNEAKIFTLNVYLLLAEHIDFLQGSVPWDPKKAYNGCYVATCVYGSYDCPEVWTLRRYRDNTLGATWYGRLFIRTYYAISPTLVKWFGSTTWFKKMWKGPLDRMVKKLEARGVENTPYEDKNW